MNFVHFQILLNLFLFRKLQHRIDTSSDFYEKFSGLQNKSKKKRKGLFALEKDS